MVGNWSSGMIPASGAGGREFDSRIAPVFFVRLLFGRFPFFMNRRAEGLGGWERQTIQSAVHNWNYQLHALLAQLGRAFDF
jgi:hypothetical protein